MYSIALAQLTRNVTKTQNAEIFDISHRNLTKVAETFV